MSNLYQTSKTVDTNLRYLMKYGIKSLTLSQYEGTVEFIGGAKYKFWNTNYPYAWLSRGEFISRSGRSYFTYDDMQPKSSTLSEFHELLTEYKLLTKVII